MNPGDEDRLDRLDDRLREVEKLLAGLVTTQRIVGGILLVLIPVITTVAIKLIHLG